MTRTLHHVDLTVSDLTLAKRFYKPVMKYLGYKITESNPRGLGFASGGDDGTGIMLHSARPQSRARKHDRYSAGLHHLAFRAASRDEVDGLHRVLQQIGATILDPPAVYYPPNYYAVFFADPDGLKLELAFHPGGH
jgi:glyoxylase I family protein